MKRLAVFLFFITSYIFGHPGIGLVYDGEQYIYYTDLNHVWRLDTSSGQSEIAIPDVHTHELYMDENGTLYGEHYWYEEGEQLFKNYVWKFSTDGKFTKIREDLEGENTDFGFVRDKRFGSYEIHSKESVFEIIRKDSTGIETLISTSLNRPTWKYLDAEERFYFVDYPSIYKLENSELTTLSKDISEKRFPFSIQGDDHSVYGIWTDTSDNVFVAIYGGRMVKMIDSQGNVSRALKTSLFWSPINGVFDNQGHLWLIESKLNGSIRVRKIAKSELYQNTSFIFENIIFIGSLLLLLVLIVFRKRIFRSNKKQSNKTFLSPT